MGRGAIELSAVVESKASEIFYGNFRRNPSSQIAPSQEDKVQAGTGNIQGTGIIFYSGTKNLLVCGDRKAEISAQQMQLLIILNRDPRGLHQSDEIIEELQKIWPNTLVKTIANLAQVAKYLRGALKEIAPNHNLVWDDGTTYRLFL